MADRSQHIIEDRVVPDVFQCREGNLIDAFQAAGSPIKFDVAPVKDVTNIYQDLAIKAAFEAIPDTVIITHSDIDAMVKPALRQEISDITMGVGIGEITDIDPYIPRLKEIESQIYKDIGAFNPDILEAVQNNIDRFASGKGDYARISKLDDLLSESFATGNYGVFTFLDQDANASFKMIHLPSTDYVDGYFQNKIEEMTGLAVKPAPGSAEEQAALIIVHELEHALGQRDDLKQYFKDVENKINDKGCNDLGFDIYGNRNHAAELESGLSEIHALRDAVPKALLEYHAAQYIALHHSDHMSKGGADRHAMSINPHYRSGEQYMTMGFQMYDYVQTGEVPDYAQTTTDVSTFFEKTRALFDDAKEMSGAAKNPDVIMLEDHIPVTMGIVEQGLRDGVYSPAEEQMAHIFLNTMGENLGIEKQSFDDAVRAAIGDQPQITPAMEDSEPVIMKGLDDPEINTVVSPLQMKI